MLKSISGILIGEDGLSTLRIAALSVTATLLVIILILREVLKPPHKRRQRNGVQWKMPPGPRGLPFFGSLHDIQKRSYETVRAFCLPPSTTFTKIEKADYLKSFGEMATLQVGSKTWVVLNSNRVVNEIINKRGSVTNGRPDYPVASDLASLGKRSIMLKVPEWTERRRVTHSILSGTALKGYTKYQDLESVRVLARYLRQPDLWFQHHAQYAAAVIYRVAFGKSISSLSPALTTSIRQVHESFIMQYLPPNNTMDCFSQLSRLPRSLQWWRKPAERLGRRSYDVYKEFWDPVHQQILQGDAPPSFARDVLIGEGARFTGSNVDAMFLSGELIEAGGDTTRLSLNIFAMAAVCYPEVIQKARDEIDAVCGREGERLPTFDDESQLTYVLAFTKELLRWRPIIAWGTEHTLTEPLDFEGYHFPPETNFVINSVTTCSDPQVFQDPQDFSPERWLDGHEGDILHGSTAFGGGRRVCVGYRLAQKSLFINISRLIYCFDFHAHGPIDSQKLNHHIHSEPFPVSPRIRSEKHRQLIVNEGSRLEELGAEDTATATV